MRKLRELSLAAALALVAAACQSGGPGGPSLTPLESERAYPLYKKLTVRWGADSSGTKTDVYLRRFDKDGRLALCGFRTPATGMDEVLIHKWFRNAQLMVDDEVVASASFLVPRQAETHEFDAEARCVQTDLEATVMRLYSGMRLQGRRVTDSF